MPLSFRRLLCPSRRVGPSRPESLGKRRHQNASSMVPVWPHGDNRVGTYVTITAPTPRFLQTPRRRPWSLGSNFRNEHYSSREFSLR
jgi:hypothetical protein